MPASPEARYRDYLELTAEGPMRARDAAARLGVSEAELVEAKATAGIARRLRGVDGFAPLLRALPSVGEVMVLTRNQHAVHESHGAYGNVDIGEVAGIVLNGGVDLRVFMRHWVTGFVVEEEVPSGWRLSLQFFDREGEALHKVYVTEATGRAAFEALVEGWVDPTPAPLVVTAYEPAKADAPDAEIDAAAMRADWQGLQDTHDFILLLKRHKVGRLQALRLVGADLAEEVSVGAITAVLEAASEHGAPIMVFVNNRGCIQIHTGPVKRVAPMGPWINVLDPGFHLHLRTDAVARAFVVRKPTTDGVVTSLELFDAEGKLFCTLFGERKPGQAEREDWRAILMDRAKGKVRA